MNLPKRFLFDLSFDPDEPGPRQRPGDAAPAETAPPEPAEPEPPPPPPPPMFSLEELRAACDHAREEGRAAGRAAAMQSIEQQTQQALTRITGQFGQLVEAQMRSDAALAGQAVLLSLAIARRLMPELARRHGLGEVEAVVRDCLPELLKEPRIVVRVAAGSLDAMRPRLDEIARGMGYDGALVVLADPALRAGDCRIDWAEGGAERLSDQLWQAIEDAVARRFEQPAETLTLAGRPVAAGRDDPAAAPPAAATA